MKKLKYAALAATLMLAVGCNPDKKETEKPLADVPTQTITLNDGQTTVTWIQDHIEARTMPRTLFPTASDSLIEALGLANGIPSTISMFLMHANGQWMLFDTGLGADKGGQLLRGLAANGLTPDSISHVFLTHFHGDHIGGMLSDGKPLFTRAAIHANHMEYMFWMTEVPADQAQQQHAVMDAYKSQLQLFAGGDTLANGIVAIGAPGHTPGHTVFHKENLLVVGDLMHGAALQMEHPEISGNYDLNRDEAARTRARIIALANENHYTMAGMHLPAPAFISFENSQGKE